MMKKVLAIILAVCISVTALSGCGKKKNVEQAADTDTVIKIGVFEPFSGTDSVQGAREALGIEFANTVLNTVEINGQTYTIELWQSDNASSATAAEACAYELIGEGCEVVIGSYGTEVTEAAAGILLNSGISMIGVSAIDKQVIEDNSNVYNISYDESFEGQVLAAFAAGQLQTTAAYMLMKNGDEMCDTLGAGFKQAFEERGASVAEGRYQDGNTDFSDYFEFAAEAGAGVMLTPIPLEDTDLLFSQLISQSVQLPLMAGAAWQSEEMLDAVGHTALSIYIPAAFDERITTDAGSQFVNQFKEWLNANVDKLDDNGGSDTVYAATALGYDAYMTAVEAIKNAASTEPAAIGAAISGTTCSGVTGSIAFSSAGSAIRDGACIVCADAASEAWRFVTYQKVQ